MMSTKVIKSEQKSNFVTFHLPADQAKFLFPILKNPKCFERLQAFLEDTEGMAKAIDEALVHLGGCEKNRIELANRVLNLLSIKNLLEEVRISRINYSFSTKNYRTNWKASTTELAQSYFINQTFNDLIELELKEVKNEGTRTKGEKRSLLTAHFFNALNSRLEALKSIGEAEAIPKELTKSLKTFKQCD